MPQSRSLQNGAMRQNNVCIQNRLQTKCAMKFWSQHRAIRQKPSSVKGCGGLKVTPWWHRDYIYAALTDVFSCVCFSTATVSGVVVYPAFSSSRISKSLPMLIPLPSLLASENQQMQQIKQISSATVLTCRTVREQTLTPSFHEELDQCSCKNLGTRH